MKPKVVKSLPDPVSNRYDHAFLSVAMRANQGEWVKIDVGPTNRMQGIASKWRTSRPRAFGPGVFEFRAISAGYGTARAKLYGRFVEGPDLEVFETIEDLARRVADLDDEPA